MAILTLAKGASGAFLAYIYIYIYIWFWKNIILANFWSTSSYNSKLQFLFFSFLRGNFSAEVEMLLPLGRLSAGGTPRNRWFQQQGLWAWRVPRKIMIFPLGIYGKMWENVGICGKISKYMGKCGNMATGWLGIYGNMAREDGYSCPNHSVGMMVNIPLSSHYNVVKTITHHPFGNGLYHLFMVKLGMVYYCFTNINPMIYSVL